MKDTLKAAITKIMASPYPSQDDRDAALSLYYCARRQTYRRSQQSKVLRELDVAIAERNRRIAELEAALAKARGEK